MPRVTTRAPSALSTLHAGQYGCVPVALMRDPRARMVHRCVYMAVASCADRRDWTCYPHVRRLSERSGASERATRSAVADLVSWGYLGEEKRAGRPSRLTLMRTAPQVEPLHALHPCTPCTPAPGAATPAPPAGDPCTPCTPPQRQIRDVDQSVASSNLKPTGADVVQVPPISVHLRSELEKRMCHGDPTVVDHVARRASEVGELAAVAELDRVMAYGFRPLAGPPLVRELR